MLQIKHVESKKRNPHYLILKEFAFNTPI